MSNYKKLQRLISETEQLIEHGTTHTSPAFQAWLTSAERLMIQMFGENSFEHKKLKDTRFAPAIYTSTSELISKCKEGLRASKLIFETYLAEASTNIQEVSCNTTLNYNSVFIVHGHDGEMKHAVARLIEKQDIQPIILSEQANKGQTIIEKFEEYSDTSSAICLFTGDDFGYAKGSTTPNTRARQNVVFETGYFIGKLGRNKVIILAEDGLELPSDMQGIVYTNKQNWEFSLLKELKEVGYTIDYNKIDQ